VRVQTSGEEEGSRDRSRLRNSVSIAGFKYERQAGALTSVTPNRVTRREGMSLEWPVIEPAKKKVEENKQNEVCKS
jgi:hypothetical protein